MNSLTELNSTDFIWPKVRDKWIALEDLIVYSKVTGPHSRRLKEWKDSWTAEEKFYLIKYYLVLSIKSPDRSVALSIESKLFSLFSQYFPDFEATKLTDFFGYQSYLIPGITSVAEESCSTQPVDFDKIFSKHAKAYVHLKSGKTSPQHESMNPKAGLFFMIEKLTAEVADRSIELQVKNRVSLIIRNESAKTKKYLSQGIWSHQQLFESRSLGPDESPKKKNKKKGKPQEFYPKKKLPPSWMIAAYIHGLYSENHFSWQEQKVTKQKLKANIGKALNQYILNNQKSVVQHFKRLIYALYADKISTEILTSAGLTGDISISRGLLEPDIDLLQTFYLRWKAFSRFDDLAMSSDKLIAHKIRVYLQYHGFDVSLSKTQILSVVSKGIKNLPSMNFSLSELPEWQENSFVQGLSQAATGGWQAIKKYGPVAVKIAVFAALLLDGDLADISTDSDDIDYFYNSTLEVEESNSNKGVSIPRLEGAAQGKALPSDQKNAKEIPTIEEMIAEHFSVYVLGMVEDYLENEQTEILIPLASKFPWLKQVQGALTETWDEYYYRLAPETGCQTEIHEKNDIERLNLLASILQVQPSWVIGLLDSFGFEIKDLEAAHQKALCRYLIRPMTHRIIMGEFFSWRDKAQACWNILGNEYIQDWTQGLTPPLTLPHIARNNPIYPEILQKLINFVDSKKAFTARDCFRKYFSPEVGSIIVEAAPGLLRVERDESWLEFALAFNCQELTEFLVAKKLEMHKEPPRLLAAMRVIDDPRLPLEDFRDLFFLALKYDKNSSHLTQVKEAMRSYSAQDISLDHIIAFAENTTAEQFKKVFHVLLFSVYRREQRRRVSFNPQVVNSFIEKLAILSPHSRQDDKICALIQYAHPISLAAFKSLIKYTSDKVVGEFFQNNLIVPSEWDVAGSLEETLQNLALSAYNYGLIETAQQLVKITAGHSMAPNNILTYWQICHAIYSPSSIGINRRLRREDFAAYDMATLSRSELKALLMHSARRALVPLAHEIMQQQAFQQEKLTLKEYCQLFKNLQISIATPRSKIQYFEIILKDIPANELTQLCIECYNRKIFLVGFLLQTHEQSRVANRPHWQCASAVKSALIMQQLLKAILPAAPTPSTARSVSRWPSLSTMVTQTNSRSKLEKFVLSLGFLDKLIQKRWYHSIHLLLPFHKDVVAKEQWLPFYEPAKNNTLRKTDYYRSFENYMQYLIKNNILHENPHKTADIIYQYWKKIGYSPSKQFAVQLLQPVNDPSNVLQRYAFDEKQKTHWIKILLKLSYMFDKNPRRRFEFWSSFDSEHTAAVAIHRTTLSEWMKKAPYADIVLPYMRGNQESAFGVALQRKFPLEFHSLGPVAQIPRFFNQGYRAVMQKPGDLVAGYHIMVLRTYLLECFRQQLSNPALAVRTEVKERMAFLMKAWLHYYGTDLHKSRAAMHKTIPQPVSRPRNPLFEGSERYWELFELNANALIESNLLFKDEAEDLQYFVLEIKDRISGERMCFDRGMISRLEEEPRIEWRPYLHGHEELNVNPIRPKIIELPKMLLFSSQGLLDMPLEDESKMIRTEEFEPSAPKKQSLLF